jgi:hypothetical protein
MCFDMKLSCLALLGILFHLLFIPNARAQQSSDSILYASAVSNLQQVYFNEIGDNAQIYHGAEYIRNGQKVIGFPYYGSDSLYTGSISYQGSLYTNIKLTYNLMSDEVIIHNYPRNAFIVLSPEKVDSFTLDSRSFLPLKSKNSTGLPGDGFYEQLLKGDPGLYLKMEKRLLSGSGSEEPKIVQYNTYLIKLRNVYYPVDGKKALLEIFKDQQDALKKYIRANKFNFKKEMEPSLIQITSYYSQLKH